MSARRSTMERAVVATAAAGGAAALVTQLAPSVTALAWVRNRWSPALAGYGDPGHIALTFDDGPDPASTPLFLDLLRLFEVRATFFIVGANLDRHPGLGQEIAEAGHELAVHGWSHRSLWARRSPTVAADLARTRDLIADLTGAWPRWYRPPHGILTTSGLLAAGQAGLLPVLWTSWGREWATGSTVDTVTANLRRRHRPGGTVLLHDAGAGGGWPLALAVLPELLTEWAAAGLRVGPLSEHGIGPQAGNGAA
jgi:peptidoglycan-N-acetylglucosamine deacetylase